MALGAIGAPMQLPAGLLKSAGLLPPRTIEEIVSAALPEFVTVTLSGELVAFCENEGKLSVPGVKVIAGAGGGGAVPVPLSGTDCGLPVALSVMRRLAAREPAAAGVKTMEMKQEWVGASAVGAPQVSDSANSAAFAPVMPMPFTLRAWSPVLESVTVCTLLGVPTCALPSDRVGGVIVATGPVTGWIAPASTLKATGKPKPGPVNGEVATSER